LTVRRKFISIAKKSQHVHTQRNNSTPKECAGIATIGKEGARKVLTVDTKIVCSMPKACAKFVIIWNTMRRGEAPKTISLRQKRPYLEEPPIPKL
jgi:hypothetical protein